jgi:hypothetical protein
MNFIAIEASLLDSVTGGTDKPVPLKDCPRDRMAFPNAKDDGEYLFCKRYHVIDQPTGSGMY